MEPRHADKISAWWLAAPLELKAGETVRYRGATILRQAGSYGELFLTTRRLAWIRRRFGPPFMRKLLKVPLSEIEGWSIERAPWWMGWGIVGSVRRAIRVRTTSGAFDLIPVYSSEGADDWAAALGDVMADAGLASRGPRK
jgi:hypothetical protein